MNEEIKKPLPKITPVSKPFYKAAREHKLLIQRCKDCQKIISYPKILCPYCMSSNTEWAESCGKGKIYSYTVVESGVPPWFESDLPFVLAIIDLKEGARLLSWVVDCNPKEVNCDMHVEVTFKDLTDEIALPMFRLAK